MKLHTDSFNTVEALERLDGDEELLKDLMNIFLDDTPGQMDMLKKAIENSSISAVQTYAHTIKSSSAYIGADKMSSSALSIERCAIEKDMSNVPELYTELEVEFNGVMRIIADTIMPDGQ